MREYRINLQRKHNLAAEEIHGICGAIKISVGEYFLKGL